MGFLGILGKIAKVIGSAVLPILGESLGFSTKQITAFQAQNEVSPQSGTLQMFQEWEQKTPDGDQVPQLKTALQKANLGELAKQHFS